MLDLREFLRRSVAGYNGVPNRNLSVDLARLINMNAIDQPASPGRSLTHFDRMFYRANARRRVINPDKEIKEDNWMQITRRSAYGCFYV